MLLRIEFGRIGRKVNNLQIAILFDPFPYGTPAMPTGIVPIENDFSCRVDPSHLFQNINSDIHVLKIGFERMFIAGLQVKKSVDILPLPSSRLAGDGRKRSLRQPDFLDGGGRGEDHFVGTEDDCVLFFPKLFQQRGILCFPRLNRLLVPQVIGLSGSVVGKLGLFEYQVQRRFGLVFDLEFLFDPFSKEVR